MLNILHVVASAGNDGRLGHMAIHASRPARMHKFHSLLTYVKHIQSPGFFQYTLYIFLSQWYLKFKQIAQNLMSLRGGCPGAKLAYMRHWHGQNLGVARQFIFKRELHQRKHTLHNPSALCVKNMVKISLVLWSVAGIIFCMSWRALVMADDLVPWLFRHPALPECTSSNSC